MTGTQSSTMPSGELRVLRNAETTLSRLRARAFFWPLPLRMVSRSDSASATRSKIFQQRPRGPPAPPPRGEADAHGPPPPLATYAARGALGLELGDVALEPLLARLDVGVLLVLDPLALDRDLRLDRGRAAVTGLVVDRGDQVGREVDDLLEVLGSQVEQVAQPAGDALEVPDVGDRSGELDVAHALTTDLGPGHLDAAALTDDALEPDPLVLAAVALPVAGRTEDLLAEEPVLLRLEGAVVDGLRLLDLAVGPLPNVLGGGQADAQLVEVVDVEHYVIPLSGFGGTKVGWREGRGAATFCAPRPAPSDLLDAARLATRQVDAQLFCRPEHVLVRVAHLQGHAVAGEHLHVEAERLHLLDEHLER